jgi:hypothetical protein
MRSSISPNSALTAAIGELMPDHLAPKELHDIAYTAVDALPGDPRRELRRPGCGAGQAAVGSRVHSDARTWQLRGAAVVTAYQRAERSLARERNQEQVVGKMGHIERPRSVPSPERRSRANT